MNSVQFSKHLEAMKERLVELFRGLGEPSDTHTRYLEESFLELSGALEELQVAEEEINQQVEELHQTRLDAEKERLRYQDLFQFAPDGYLVTNLDGIIQEANQAASEIIGLSERRLRGKPLSVYIDQTDQKVFRKILLTVPNQKGPIRFEINMSPRVKGGDITVAAFTEAPVVDDRGSIKAVRWLIRDITREKVLERTLLDSEERFRTIYQDAPLGIQLLDNSARIINCNPTIQEMLGYSEADLEFTPIVQLLHAEDRDLFRTLFKELIEKQREKYKIEIRFLRRDGGIRWGKLAVSRYESPHQDPRVAIAMIEDITEAREMSQELQELQRRLFEGIEIERNRLANDLHDGPIQDLYAVTFRLSTVNRAMTGRAAQVSIQETTESIHRVIAALRTTCGELKPPTLAPFGLKKAMLSYIDQIHAFNPEIDISVDLDNDTKLLPERIRLALFRIFQQAFINAVRHSDANHIWVSFHIQDHHVEVAVRDDGKGFPKPQSWLELVRQGHYGLAGAAERAEAHEGQLTIESAPGKGTVIQVEIPFSEQIRSSN